MKLTFTLLIQILLIPCYLLSQDDPNVLSIGILPVTNSTNEAGQYRENVREKIINVFASKSRFTVVDRSRLDAIYKERDLQKGEDFLDGSIVEQGKSIGAQMLVSTNISTYRFNRVIIQKEKWGLDKNNKIYTYKVNVPCVDISFGVNITMMDVSTGVVKSTKNISTGGRYEDTEDIHRCTLGAINELNGYMLAWVNNVFPVEMKIIQIESVDKKGLPRTVLIKGGSDMNMSDARKGSELEVFEKQIINVDGKDNIRKLTIGKIFVESVEGDLSVCSIKEGKEIIQKKLSEGKTLYIKINQY